MPRNQTEAIVLTASRFKEQDKLVLLYSPGLGLIEGVAKGALKSRHRFGCGLEPMSHVKVFFYEKENHRYVTVSHCDLVEDFIDLQADPDILFTFALFSELVRAARPAGGADSHMFRLLRETLRAFKSGGDTRMLTAYFEAWYLRLNGLLPDFRTCARCEADTTGEGWLASNRDGARCARCADSRREPLPEGLSDFLEWIRRNPPPSERVERFDPESLRNIRRMLERLIVYHLEQVPRALSCLANGSDA